MALPSINDCRPQLLRCKTTYQKRKKNRKMRNMSQLYEVTEDKDYVEGLVLYASGLAASELEIGEEETGKQAPKASLSPML